MGIKLSPPNKKAAVAAFFHDNGTEGVYLGLDRKVRYVEDETLKRGRNANSQYARGGAAFETYKAETQAEFVTFAHKADYHQHG